MTATALTSLTMSEVVIAQGLRQLTTELGGNHERLSHIEGKRLEIVNIYILLKRKLLIMKWVYKKSTAYI